MAKQNLKMKRVIMFWSKVFILIVQTVMYGYLWFHHYKDMMPVQYWRRGNWAIVGLYLIILYFFSRTFGSLKVGYLKTWDVMYSQIFSIICVNGITYIQLALINGDWKLFENAAPMFALCGLDLIVVFVWAVFMRWVYAILYPPHEMVLVYQDINPKNLIAKLNTRPDKYQVVDMVHITTNADDILSQLDEHESVIIADVPSHERNQIIKYCYSKNIRCYGVPKISDVMIRYSDDIDLFDTQLLLFRNGGLSYRQELAKRVMDIAVSLLGIIVASPILLVSAVAIKSYDKGPVFYTQKRLTKDGREFDILKFRSMIVESEAKGAQLAKADDDRITPVGRILRRSHFDELPQLFNILKGDMSVVGPRPERKEIADKYGKEIPEFSFRLKVKAGLTGYAQVYGQYNTEPLDKLKLDLTYIEHYSLWLDIKLMVLTVKILFAKEKSEGVDNKQTTALKEK
ncbi:MAG: exopolysaccharide biosynthesis polyprenyl glycosylphosphotransferase [Lachnospiraceae bacterium]|nr:exopolysaccharide biosynthesis polyprenyl glycosylphosphotransferase [Lachnospiraceae bacterium]